MARSPWFWLGWACLVGALTGWVDLVPPLAQFALIGLAILAFRQLPDRPNEGPRTG